MPIAIHQLKGGEGSCCPPPGLAGLFSPPPAQPPGYGGSSSRAGGPKAEGAPSRLPAHLSPPPPGGGRPQDLGEEEYPAAQLQFALDQLSLLGLQDEQEAGGEEGAPGEEAEVVQETGERGGAGPRADEAMEAGDAGGLDRFSFPAAGTDRAGLLLLDLDSSPSPSCAASPVEIFGAFPPHLAHPLPPQHPLLPAQLGLRKKSVNMTECVSVPSSEHVAEIVGRQGCKIKALRAKTNTYIKTPVRGEDPVFIVTGRKEDVELAKREILSAAEHFSVIRATRNKANGGTGSVLGPPNLPGQTTIQVRVPYRVVGLVVGPKGATIKRIQQQTHTYIVTPSRDKEPIFEVTGMPENVDRAREEIEAHITMRTGSLIDTSTDNDFHSNGTDVCLDLLASSSSSLWSKAPKPAGCTLPSLHNENLGSLGAAAPAAEPYFEGPVAEGAPGSPFGSSTSFPFSEATASVLGSDDCDFGFEFLTLDLTTPTTIWSPFEPPAKPLQTFSSISSAHKHTSSLSNAATPRHSPTLPEMSKALAHPLAQCIQSDPATALSWLKTQGSLSAHPSSTGHTSSSSSSLPGSSSATSGSPTDSSSSDGARKSTRECMVCFESEVIAALVPCGHNLFCMECAVRICGRAEPECPACHMPVTQAIHIFS